MTILSRFGQVAKNGFFKTNNVSASWPMLKAGTGSACFGGMPPTLGMLPYTKSNPKVLFGTKKKKAKRRFSQPT
jgi:hypothetical protein